MRDKGLVMKHRYQQRPAGFSLLEVMVVAVVVMIFSAMLLGGITYMMNNQRLSTSTDKVLSTLNLAKSLAITHNAIYQVRIQNYTEINGAPDFTQAISVHCFPRANAALSVQKINRVTGQPLGTTWPISGAPLTGRVTGIASTNISVISDDYIGRTVEAGAMLVMVTGTLTGEHAQISSVDPLTGTINLVTPLTAAPVPGTEPGKDDTLFKILLRGYRVAETRLEQDIYFGLQGNKGASAPDDSVLFFMPDGTASKSLSLFVTNRLALRDNPKESDWIWADRNAIRHALHERKLGDYTPPAAPSDQPGAVSAKGSMDATSYCNIIQVFQGGMIRLVQPLDSKP